MLRSKFISFCQKASAMLIAPTNAQVQMMLLLLGVALISGGISLDAVAQLTTTDIEGADFNDERIGLAINKIFAYVEGSFGALIMIVAGLGAIMAAALGSYSAALGLLVVAVGAFILRSLVTTFFNTQSIADTE